MSSAATGAAANDGSVDPTAARGLAPALRTEIHDDAGAFDALDAEWRSLAMLADNGCTFACVDWHRTWWRVYARPHDRLHLVTFRLGEALVGVLPLYRRRTGAFGAASLQFVGTGEPRGEEVVTEYADLLAYGAIAPAIGAVALAHLLTFARWRRVELRCLLEDSVLLRAMREHPPAHALLRSAGRRYRVDLADGEGAHLSRLGSSRSRRIARSRRAVARDGGLARVPSGPRDDIDAAFATLAGLHADRQRRLGRRGAFAAARFARFHRELADALAPSRGVEIAAWRVGDTPVAALHLFAHGDTLHYYQSGFATAGANRWMPLTLAHLDRMRLARTEGFRWYDLMRGEPPCYKDHFGCETTPMTDASLFASGSERRAEAVRRDARSRLADALARSGIRRR